MFVVYNNGNSLLKQVKQNLHLGFLQYKNYI